MEEVSVLICSGYFAARSLKYETVVDWYYLAEVGIQAYSLSFAVRHLLRPSTAISISVVESTACHTRPRTCWSPGCHGSS